MYAKALKTCLCGDDLSETVNNCVGCKPKCGLLWKILLWILVSVLCLAITAGLAYLVFVVGTNAFSLLFDDTICTNWIWQTCESYVKMNQGYSLSGLQMSAGYIVSALVLLVAIAILSFCIYFEKGDRHVDWYFTYLALYGIWAYVFAWVSIFCGKHLAVNKFDGCQDYKNYGIILMNLFPDYGFTLCAKIRNIGPNQGAIEDRSLPGDWGTCNKCMNMGFWSIYLGALALPLLVLAIVMGVRRYRRKLDELKNTYQPLSTVVEEN